LLGIRIPEKHPDHICCSCDLNLTDLAFDNVGLAGQRVYWHGIEVAPDNFGASRWYRLAQQHGDSVNQELWAIDLVRNPDPQSRDGAAAVQLA